MTYEVVEAAKPHLRRRIGLRAMLEMPKIRLSKVLRSLKVRSLG